MVSGVTFEGRRQQERTINSKDCLPPTAAKRARLLNVRFRGAATIG
jgi:hypothetical protein